MTLIDNPLEGLVAEILYEEGAGMFIPHDPKVDKLLTLIASEVKRARIDEVLKMRAVGDKVATQPGSTFKKLCTAYDNHILKRAADLTEEDRDND